MSVFDVRSPIPPIISIIQFADDDTSNTGFAKAYQLTIRTDFGGNTVAIADHDGEFVLISNRKHAQDLVAAINKAIELSWFK